MNITCKICQRIAPNELSGACASCIISMFSDGTGTVQSVGRLLELKTATLKRLEATKQLVVLRNNSGSRRYTRESIESYLTMRGEIYTSNLLHPAGALNIFTKTDARTEPFSDLCRRCGANNILNKGYCSECLDDFISKRTAAELILVSPPTIDRLIGQFPEYLHAYSYGDQIRLSRRKVEFMALEKPHVKLKAEKWSDHFRQCRLCKETNREHYGGGYCVECYPKTHEAEILRGYIDGENKSEIGLRLDLSRERIRQLLRRAIEIDILRIGNDVSENDRSNTYMQIELAHKQNRASSKYKQIIEDNYEYIIKALSQESISSEARMLQRVGLPASSMHLIEDAYPEFLEIISHNKNRWSWKYHECRMCGSNKIKHMRWGYCSGCYTRSSEWKEQQLRYRTNNKEKLRERQSAYLSEYYRRPDVKRRQAERSYRRRYDGNREAAIVADQYLCRECGIEREEHKLRYGHDLSVFHVDGDLKNNDPGNLITLCKSCVAKRGGNLHGRAL